MLQKKSTWSSFQTTMCLSHVNEQFRNCKRWKSGLCDGTWSHRVLKNAKLSIFAEDWKWCEKCLLGVQKEKSDNAFNIGIFRVNVQTAISAIEKWGCETENRQTEKTATLFWIFVATFSINSGVSCKIKKDLRTKAWLCLQVAAYQMTTLATTKGVNTSKMKHLHK